MAWHGKGRQEAAVRSGSCPADLADARPGVPGHEAAGPVLAEAEAEVEAASVGDSDTVTPVREQGHEEAAALAAPSRRHARLRRRHGWSKQAHRVSAGLGVAVLLLGWSAWLALGAGWVAADHPLGGEWTGLAGRAAAAWALSALLAVVMDAWLGEWPTRWHPVAWLGRGVQRWQGRWLAGDAPGHQRRQGRLAWWVSLAGVLLAVSLAQALGWALLWACPASLGVLGAALAWALVLKPAFAGRMLLTEVAAVEAALCQSLGAGRQRLSWLVSRDTWRLDATEVREAAIETLSENLVDAWVAPWGWWLAGGPLLGPWVAWTYRHANTLDAMWGYRDARKHWGRHAARADDVLSAWPARLGGWAIVGLARAHGLAVDAPAWAREREKTPSPNGGWPMSAMALALDVRLRKPGGYDLHPAGGPADARQVRRALRLAVMAGALLWLGVMTMALAGVALVGAGLAGWAWPR